MAKKKSKRTPSTSAKEAKDRVTLEALDAISDSDDEEIPESQWSTKAKNLRQAIKDGRFDHLVEAFNNDEDSGSEIEEAVLDSSSSDEEPNGDDQSDEVMEEDAESVSDDDKVIDEGDEEGDSIDNGDDDKDSVNEKDEGKDQSDEDSDTDDEDSENEDNEKMKRLKTNNSNSSKALAVVTAELVAAHSQLPWAETFCIVPATPLPFGDNGDPETNPLDIHDDLKREVAFYNSALEAVNEARLKCKKAGITFSRPEDFFAEMVKTDDHMAKVKDKLIFETKKMEAVAQRKSNREQKLRAKESHANRLAEKAKRKRDHFQQVEEWANSVARNRGGALQDDADDMYLNRGPNKKRQKADRKFGFGGKRGRFKQNDRASMNDVSGFNPRGNFPGMGTKKSAKSKSGSGSNRQGKRARDANRARRSY